MTLIEQMRERRAQLKAELDALLGTAESRDDKNLTEDEAAKFDGLVVEIRKADERSAELEQLEVREAAAAETRRLTGGANPATVVDPPVYVKDSRNGNSFFRDLARRDKDPSAAERLFRAAKADAAEQRALGNTNAAGGSGGEFAPPNWMISEWINIIRAGRITVDLYRKMDIPDGYSSINIPRLTGGTTTALQTTQNSALSQTDATTSYVQTGWATVGGKQVISQQLLDQSALPLDTIILNDLAADYARQVGLLTFTGTGTGAGTNSVVNGLTAATVGTTQTWTQAAPTAPLFYSQAAALLQKFLTARLMPPTCWVMAPRRWYWLVSAADTTGRPFVVPVGPSFNQLATNDNPAIAQGLVGTMHGLPVYIDPQIPQTVAASQDVVYLLKTDDLIMFESAPRAESFRETFADSVGVLFRLYAYFGAMLNRHPESIGLLTGTGLVPPVFPA